MIDPNTITNEQLANSQFVADLTSTIDEIVRRRQTKDAARLFHVLHDRPSTLPETLRVPMNRLAVSAFPLLSEEESGQLLAGDIRDILMSSGRDRVRERLLAVSPVGRDKIKSHLLSQLEGNQTPLTDGGFRTVSAWLERYRTARRSPDQFMAESIDVQTLSPADRDRVRELTRLVHDLESSSLTNEGLEEEVVVRDASGAFRLWSKGAMQQFTADDSGPVAPPAVRPVVIAPPSARPAAPPPQAPATPRAAAATADQPLYSTKANFFFHTEDDDEIRAHAKRLAHLGQEAEEPVQRVVQSIIDKFRLSFSDDELRSRFLTIAVSRLKEIRDTVETRTMLVKSPAEGGLGYSVDLATSLVNELEQYAGRSLLNQPPQPLPVSTVPAVVPSLPVANRPAVPPPPPVPKADERQAVPVPTPSSQTRTIPVQAVPRPTPPPVRRPVVVTDVNRPHVADIRNVKRTIGPIDELEHMSVGDFQRLGHTTAESIGKIIEKLDILEEESFGKRLAGITAWRRSPLFQLYLMLGRESMTQERPVADVIAARTKTGSETLDEEEFQSIADLNKKLRL